MHQVKQVRVLRKALVAALGSGWLLWLVRGQIAVNSLSLIYGGLLGIGVGYCYWSQLRHKIERADRRFDRNKIFVTYMGVGEIALTALAHNQYLGIPIALIVLMALWIDYFSANWFVIALGSFGLSAAVTTAVGILREEQSIGPLYYQYDTRWWHGAEGMLYQKGNVVRALDPCGVVRVRGELWRAESAAGESIAVGEKIEVLSLQEGLTLSVDRVGPLQRCSSHTSSSKKDPG